MESPYDILRDARALEYAQAQKDLGLFVQTAWPVLEPRAELRWNWHHDLICEHLQAAYEGEIRRLVINVAPRSMKSIMTSICFPAWMWTMEPAMRMLFGSYADTLSTELSVLRRNLIESDWYQDGYGDRFRLASDANTKSEFSNDKTGMMKAAGIKAVPMGKGGDFVIIDDPHNPKGAESERDREQAVMNFDLGWSARLNDKKTGRIIVIMQRLHDRDLTGHLLAQGGYTHLKIPTIAEERERIVFPVSNRVVTREYGDLLHPERDGPVEIEQAKRDLQDYGFAGQHQQNPAPRGGGLFTEAMFDYVDDLPALWDYEFILADTAFTDKQSSDFTCFTAFGMAKGELYIQDVLHRQMKATDIEVPAEAFILRFQHLGFRGAYIEPKGHGIYLNQTLPKKGILIPSEEKLKEFFADRRFDKVERANNAVPWLANRRIHVYSKIANKELLVAQVLKFPKADYDDFTDTVIDGVKFAFAGNRSGTPTKEMSRPTTRPVSSEARGW